MAIQAITNNNYLLYENTALAETTKATPKEEVLFQEPQLEGQISVTQEELQETEDKTETKSFFKKVSNWFSDWFNDEDKTCTDGNNDGKLSFKEGLESFGKGLLGIVKTAVKHPIATGLTVAAGIGLSVLTGGAAAPFLCAAGAAIGGGTIVYGGYKAATAKTDAEAKQAWETVGNGTFAVAASVLSAKSAVKNADAAGVVIDKADDLNSIQALGACFKSTPASITTSAKNIANNSVNIFKPGLVNINGTKTLVNADDVQSASDGIKVFTQDFKNISPRPNAVEVKSVPSGSVATPIAGSSLDDSVSADLVGFLNQFDDVRLEDWGSWNSLADLKIGVLGNNAYMTNAVSTTEAIGILSGNVSPVTQAYSGLLGAEVVQLIEDDEV